MGFFSALFDFLKERGTHEIIRYSSEWLENVYNMSDSELDEERERTRNDRNDSNSPTHSEASRMLWNIDRELARRREKAYKDIPVKNPSYRWTDANRWDKD